MDRAARRNIRDAYSKDSAGSKIVDFAKSTCSHELQRPGAQTSPLEDSGTLIPLPQQPTDTYRTSYYAENGASA